MWPARPHTATDSISVGGDDARSSWSMVCISRCRRGAALTGVGGNIAWRCRMAATGRDSDNAGSLGLGRSAADTRRPAPTARS